LTLESRQGGKRRGSQKRGEGWYKKVTETKAVEKGEWQEL